MENQIDEAFYIVGLEVFPVSLNARKASKIELINSGKKWLENRKTEICFNLKRNEVQVLFKGRNLQMEEQLRILVDVLATLKLGIPPLTLAKAILILGESWFCNKI